MAGFLIESADKNTYTFEYLKGYSGFPVLLTMPIEGKSYTYEKFPPFFDGVLPEGMMLEGLLRQKK